MSFYKEDWWKESVGYQIYLKSFKDSNNDGIGDLNGIKEKLDYFKFLGVNLLWICPFYASPMIDNGYDVSDYLKVDPSYGTIDDYKEDWWKESVGYQIYLKSFKDSNNDGIGDLNGIKEKLDYFKFLGVNLLWICPFYASPMIDNGYDVSDYLKVDPSYGTIDDFKDLIKEAKKRDIKVIIDLVLNQTSDQHPWFINSRKSKNSLYRDYYIWKKGRKTKNGIIEPTNWASFFGGSVWEYDSKTDEYYLKIFSKHMPDLNWENENLRKQMHDVARFWLNLGVDGFRVDAVAHLAKNRKFKNSKINKNEKYQRDYRKFSNLDDTFVYLKEFKKKVFSDYDIVTIGEVGGGATVKEAIKYSGLKKGSLDMVFNFDHTFCKKDKMTDLIRLKEVFNRWQTKTYKKAWVPLYWLNHDHPRVLSHYGNEDKPFLSGSMLALALYFKRGTPFIYQGEELGMVNYPFKDITEFNDVSFINGYEIEKQKPNFNEKEFFNEQGPNSRDNARTIFSWDDSLYAGFSNSKPWFHLDKNYQTRNVKKAINDKNSLYAFYRKIFKLRKHEEYRKTLIYGKYKQLHKKDEDVYCYLRKEDKEILVVVNFFDKTKQIEIKGYNVKEVLLSNYKQPEINLRNLNLRPYEATVYLVERI